MHIIWFKTNNEVTPCKIGVHVLMVDAFYIILNHCLILGRSNLKCFKLIHPLINLAVGLTIGIRAKFILKRLIA